jgi:hypothetical protein
MALRRLLLLQQQALTAAVLWQRVLHLLVLQMQQHLRQAVLPKQQPNEAAWASVLGQTSGLVRCACGG